MNITTENIDEWCFRYLEKDLNEEECVFFENELKSNPSITQQVALWRKTILLQKDFALVDHTVTNNLFRYKTQFLFALIEFIFISSILCFLIWNGTKEIAPVQNSEIIYPPSTVSSDSVVIEHIPSMKPRYVKRVPDQKAESILVFKNIETKTIESDTIENVHFVATAPEQIYQDDSIKILSDTTLTKTKSSQKKISTKRKYKGSRLLPINNDL